MIAISRQLKNPCYKFMFMMGVIDIPGIVVGAIIGGLFGLIGAVYCTAPNIMYITGITAFSIDFE